MSYTLISLVGTGMYNDGYRTTNYVFPDGHQHETSIFVEALRKAQYRDFSKIILVGTETSGWDMLVEDNSDFWSEILLARENKALTEQHFSDLEKILSEKYGVPVIIKKHTDIIDNDSSVAIYDTYNSIVENIEDENILFDITHGFRSMPVLLFQAIQYSISRNPKIRNVELVYGEYIGSEKLSYVRDLSNYWKYSQIADATLLFESKLDGFRLKALLEAEWPDGADCVKRISEIVQTNYSLQINEAIKNINNVLKKCPEDISNNYKKVIDVFRQISKLEDKKSQARTLYNFAGFLFARQLNTQAIIALQLSVEVAFAEKYGGEEAIGNYDWWKDNREECLKPYRSHTYSFMDKLEGLNRTRNQIAHGGSKSKTGGFPNGANIQSQFKSYHNGVKSLLTELNL